MSQVSSQSMIEARGLSKSFGPFAAIQDLSFSIPRGEIVAFLGPNGAGKTTTMRILTGYLAPTSGSASIAGLDVGRDRLEAAARVGYLPENGPLYPDMTPLELLRFFGEARGLDARKVEQRIEPRHRLVEKDHLGLVQQRLGQAHALRHPLGVLAQPQPPLRAQSHVVQHARHARGHLGPAQAKQPREVGQQLLRREVIVKVRVLGQEADAVFDGGVADRSAEDAGRARRGVEQLHQQLQRRALAGPVRTKETEDLPLLHRERQAIKSSIRTRAPEAGEEVF